jgi:hypothetical protein
MIRVEEWSKEQSGLLRGEYYRKKEQNPEKLSRVQFPVKMVSVARKISTREDQSWLFRKGDYRNNSHNTENCPGLES